MSVDNDTRHDLLSEIAIAQAQSGDITRAKKTLLLIEAPSPKSKTMQYIAIEEAKKGDTARIKELIIDMKKMQKFTEAITLTLELARLARSSSRE